MDENPIKEINISVREATIVVALIISVVIAILIMSWVKEPDYRPLVQDMRLVDAVKIVDVLEQNNISYHADIKNHILYVSEQQAQEARLHLARIGTVIEYPRYEDFGPLPEACLVLSETREKVDRVPIWEEYWFLKVVRMMISGMAFIVLILAVVRPMLKTLIYPEDK